MRVAEPVENTKYLQHAVGQIELHCVSKNIRDFFSYNSRKHCRILIIFGRIIDKASNQKMLYFSTSPN